MPKNVEIGQFYLFGNSRSRHKSIVWVNSKDEKNDWNIYGRELKLESRGTLSQFFSFGSFLAPIVITTFFRN